MINEAIVALFLLICLVAFCSVNLHNILKLHTRRGTEKVYAEVKRPHGVVMALAALGTLVHFVATLLFLVFAFAGFSSVMSGFPFGYLLPFMECGQILGLVLAAFGYSLFMWSVIVRGKYAVSWEMPEHQKLVTSGPYRYVRHPSYLGYFLMFTGLFLLWSNLFTASSIVAIPGYYRLTFEEERLLSLRFGENYVEYQKKTGRFIPKLQ